MTFSKSSILIGLTLILVFLEFRPTNSAPILQPDEAVVFLSKFGYLAPKATISTNAAMMTNDPNNIVSESVRKYQRFHSLNVTGELDVQVREHMSRPRCGAPDIVPESNNSHISGYSMQGSRWPTKSLTYKISSFPKLLDHSSVRSEIRRAFDKWSEFTDLTFTEKNSGEVDISIDFFEGEHGDGYAFDGKGYILAHAFYPQHGGQAHFDDAEHWTIGSTDGTNLFQVAAHEFGHSLGLDHTGVQSALMYPHYKGFDSSFQLDYDDISGIQALYGTKALPVSNICENPNIDAMFNSHDGTNYAFKGAVYYRFTKTGVAAGYPKYISDGWPGLPDKIDAAFTGGDDKTYFFKGSKYWRYSGNQLDSDYPQEISQSMPGLPNNLDAAMFNSYAGKFFYFKGSEFWISDGTTISPPYPNSIAGLPNDLDAVHQNDNYMYFFKGKLFFKYSFGFDGLYHVNAGTIGAWLFGCPNNWEMVFTK